jgi:cyclopropane fatty-acyl-phospholipid synthase-like methyltransferase
MKSTIWNREPEPRPWDSTFERWVSEAASQGLDPNDVGDQEWENPLPHLQQFYFPHIRPDSVVLELGPGSGRITRHLIGRCREILLVDFSAAACKWLGNYLPGKGNFKTYIIDKPQWPAIGRESVDFFCAFGVFEHIGLDDMRWYLEEIERVLVPGGIAIFNFDNLMSPEGIEWHKQWRRNPGDRNIFRFYHPDMVRRLAEVSALEVTSLRASDSRHAEIELKKP